LWITLAPALPLVAHFLPYYLFLPVAGLSIALGTAITWLYDRAARFHGSVAMTSAVYEASPIKRVRSTQAQVGDRRAALYCIVAAQRPMSVRQVFYQATVRNLVDKTEAGYTKVQTDLVLMRKSGLLPYSWLADSTRMQRRPRTYNSVQDALERTALFYRKSLWADADAYVEIWLEKDALSGVIYPVTSMYDVPLMVARGYASLSFLHSSAEDIIAAGKPTYIYHLGDFDPSGVNAGEKIEQTLKEMVDERIRVIGV
jgi:hypothetical protein